MFLGVARQRDGQPAHEPHVDVVRDLESELADVERECFVLVEDGDRGDSPGRVAQQRHSALDASALEVAVRRVAGHLAR